MTPPLVPPLPVLVDENVFPEFQAAVAALPAPWPAPSGRRYQLALAGPRLEVALLVDTLDAHPGEVAIDGDLLELACALHDAAGPPWSGAMMRQVAAAWGFDADDPDAGPKVG